MTKHENETMNRLEAGFSLAEVLVGVTVMAIVFVAAFMVYDNLQKSFKMNENAATQQQNTRAAFDKLVADVRLAGFNYNPDGDETRPDEQVEGMWDNAITVRGDYDAEDSSLNTTPESTLGGPSATFDVVSIGNDEIVTYALGKPDGTGGTTISFVADVQGVPRNGTQETVSISNVHLTQGNPPYTLYRYSVAPNSNTIVKQPVADNIKSLEFIYYSGAVDPNSGNPITLTSVGGAEDPNDVEQRDRITKIGVKVIGMTEDPDLAYLDPSDSNALTTHHRKFTLETDVTPRNFDYVGRVDLDLDDPNSPLNFTACQGHCGGTYLKWDHPGDVDITSYTVSWGDSPTTLTSVVNTPDDFYYVGLVTGPTYFAARSVDFAGNTSPKVLVGPSSPTNVTVPAQVTGVSATGDQGGNVAPVDNQVVLAWAPLSGNTVNLSCDETPFPIRDLAGYRVFKGTTTGFDPNNPTEVVQEWDPNSIPGTVSTLTDGNVVNCRQYFYMVQGEDECALSGAVSSEADGASTTSVPPAAPLTVLATDMGLNIHTVTWNAVTEDAGSPARPILIDKYNVYRALVDFADDPNQASYSTVFSGAVSNPAAPSFQDPNVPTSGPSQSFYYKISALDDCPNESALSLPAEAYECVFGGSVYMTISPGGSQLAGSQTISIGVSGPAVQVTRLVIADTTTGTMVFNQTDATAPYTYSWNASSVPPGRPYRIVALATNVDGCTDSTETMVDTVNAIACCISTSNPNLSPTTGSLKNNELFFDIINNCGADVSIDSMSISFTGNGGQNPLLDQVEYNIFDVLTTGRLIDLLPDNPSPVNINFSGPLAPSLDLLAGNDDTNPVRLRYEFTQAMLNKQGSIFVGESIATRFNFSVASQSGIGQCILTVVTNPLSIVGCDPATDPSCSL